MQLADLLEIQPGVTAVIGGGGKTSLLWNLGNQLAGKQHTVLLCTTTKILPFPEIPCARTARELEYLRNTCRFFCAGQEIPETGKLTTPPIPMVQLASWFDYVLVEADGAAHRPLKAHAPHEPVIPKEANQTICVVGASGFGQPIAQAAHRPERYADLAGAAKTEEATPETEAAVLLAEKLHHRVFVNQVETAQSLAAAKQLAELVDAPVIAGSLQERKFLKCW